MIHQLDQRPTVLANGCFDILHVGHLRFLQFCKKLNTALEGSRLIVAIDSDEKITKDKGRNRPVFTLNERRNAIHLALEMNAPALQVPHFSTNDELRLLIKRFNPILVKGSEWRGQVVGEEFSSGVIYYDQIYTPSTTEIIKRVWAKNE